MYEFGHFLICEAGGKTRKEILPLTKSVPEALEVNDEYGRIKARRIPVT